MSRRLIENIDISEGERRGLQTAVAALKGGIRAVYDKAGREMPTSVRQELDFYRDEDG